MIPVPSKRQLARQSRIDNQGMGNLTQRQVISYEKQSLYGSFLARFFTGIAVDALRCFPSNCR